MLNFISAILSFLMGDIFLFVVGLILIGAGYIFPAMGPLGILIALVGVFLFILPGIQVIMDMLNRK